MAGRLEREELAQAAWGNGSGQVENRRHSEEVPPPRDTLSSNPPEVRNVVAVEAPLPFPELAAHLGKYLPLTRILSGLGHEENDGAAQ